MKTFQDVCQAMESWAPLAWQADYDNAGLLVGHPQTEIKGVLIAFDCLETHIEEAIARGCNLVIAHHPILFKGIKKLNGKNYVERTLMRAIQAGVGIYAAHTNLDHAPAGVSHQLAKRLGLEQIQVLDPMEGALKSLVYMVPPAQAEAVRLALHAAGAGNIGAYSACSFSLEGWGRFTPSANTQPFVGVANQAELIKEERVEMIFPAHLENQVVSALKKAHPYEEVAYFILQTQNQWQDVGAGCIGQLPKPLSIDAFAALVKERLHLPHFKCYTAQKEHIHQVALCGGAGAFLISKAKARGADAYLTGDLKYHEYFDGEDQMLLADIGHYESEVMIIEAMHAYLSNIFSNFAVLKSERVQNPITYL